LDGCPHELIYNSATTLEKLKKYNNFNYINNIYVDKLYESDNNVKIFARNIKENQPVEFQARRVYLASGVLSSSRIMLETMGKYDQPLNIKESQYFILPLIRFGGLKNVSTENLHTLCQIFIEIFDKELCDKTIHLQLYTYNKILSELLKKKLKIHDIIPKSIINKILSRLLFIQGYLHSDYSSTCNVSLSRNTQNKIPTMHLDCINNDKTEKIINCLVKKLYRNKLSLKFVPIKRMLNITEFGKGFHVGCTFPMSKNPKENESDLYGRPFGFKKIHMVDASIFNSIPATTITLTAMANAYRIANEFDAT